MKDAIRLAVCLVMATTSTPVFADTGDQTRGLDDDATISDSTKHDDVAAGGSGEPQGADARDRADTTVDVVQARTHSAFVQQIWAALP